jgi:PST family polysaccharide transporter
VALNFLLLSTGIVQNSILVRALKFKRIALINMAAIGLAGITGIVMAVLGYGIWSIVVQGLLLSSLTSLLYWFTSGVKIRLGFDRTAFSSMFNFGGHAAADSVLSYWARNLDNLLIAKFLGDISLGLYSKAYSIMLLPLVNFSQVISRVLFPSFSSIQNDREKIRRVYLRITRIIAFVTFPLMIALWALAENIVLVFLGQDWTGMIPLLEILCWLGIPQSILTLNGSIYHSLGRADLAFRVGLILKLNLVIGFVAGLYFGGLLGLALGYAIAGTVNFYPSFYFAGRLIDLKLGEQLKNLQGIVGCALAMGIFVFAAKQGRLLEGWGLLQELLVLTAGGAVLYLLLLFLFKIPVLDELKVELRSVLTKEP